jgi:hypothetical protein
MYLFAKDGCTTEQPRSLLSIAGFNSASAHFQPSKFAVWLGLTRRGRTQGRLGTDEPSLIASGVASRRQVQCQLPWSVASAERQTNMRP